MEPSRTFVLLDLDGTLVDSLPGILQAMSESFAANGLDPPTAEEIRSLVGPPLPETFGALLGLPPDDAAVTAATAVYRARYAELMVDGSEVFEGIPEVLDALAGAGLTLAVATSKAQPLADGLLEGLGLASRFAAIAGPALGTRDDKAATIAAALRALGDPDPATGAMVGDRHHDIDGARAHGLHAIGALWGFGDPPELAGADALAATPADLVALLLG